MIDKWFKKPFDVYASDGTCYPDVIHVEVRDNDSDSYIEDVNGEILFFDEMDYSMVENVLEIVETK
jgi:hypothetical protein